MAKEFWTVMRLSIWYDILEDGEREITDILTWESYNRDKIYYNKESAFWDCWKLCSEEFDRQCEEEHKKKLYGYVVEFEKTDKYCICRKVYKDNKFGSEDRFFIQRFEV